MILQETYQVDLKDVHAVTDAHFIDPSQFLADQLAEASPDLLRSMLSTFMQSLMGADADAQCNADYGQRNPERTNSRNGYRPRQLDTRGPAPSSWRCRSSAPELTSRTGCSSPANAPRRP